MSERSTVVTLVHGTFARNAEWTKQGSLLTDRLDAAGYEVVRFPWSGRNSFHARRQAATELSRHLFSVNEDNPGVKQIVISHSHGGNVALQAVHDVEASVDAFTGGRIELISLATPYIYATRRKTPLTLLIVAAWVGILVLFSTLVLASLGENAGNVHLEPYHLILAVVILAEFIVVGIGLKLHGRPNVVDNIEVHLDSELGCSSVQHGQLLAIRAPGDEATAMLGSGQVLTWLNSKIERIIFPLLMSLCAVGGTIAVPGLIVLAMQGFSAEGGGPYAANPFHLDGWISIVVVVGLISFLVLALAAYALVTVAFLPALGFGIDGPYLSLFFLISAESAPPGECALVHTESRAVNQAGLAHSSLYFDEEIIGRVISRINGIIKSE
jgi:hypothetical protein